MTSIWEGCGQIEMDLWVGEEGRCSECEVGVQVLERAMLGGREYRSWVRLRWGCRGVKGPFDRVCIGCHNEGVGRMRVLE